jgi:hypothetical protein
MNRKARDRKIAEEVVAELAKALGGPVIRPEALVEHSDTVGDIFGRVLDAHHIASEFAAANIMKCVPRILAKAERNRRLGAAIRKTP